MRIRGWCLLPAGAWCLLVAGCANTRVLGSGLPRCQSTLYSRASWPLARTMALSPWMARANLAAVIDPRERDGMAPPSIVGPDPDDAKLHRTSNAPFGRLFLGQEKPGTGTRKSCLHRVRLGAIVSMLITPNSVLGCCWRPPEGRWCRTRQRGRTIRQSIR